MTNAELAILSLIAEKPRHGYAIEQTIEERGLREWTEIGFSSIYYLLNKLENAGLIKSYLEQVEGKGPARKMYRVTNAGRKAQAAATYQVLAAPRAGAVPFLLGLSNFPVLPLPQAIEAMRTYRRQLTERRQHLVQRADAQPDKPFFVSAMFDYSLTLLQAEITWLDKFIRNVEEQANGES